MSHLPRIVQDAGAACKRNTLSRYPSVLGSKDAADLAKPVAQAKTMADVMPLWSQLRERHKLAAPDAGWIASLSFFEAQIVRENFDRIVKKY